MSKLEKDDLLYLLEKSKKGSLSKGEISAAIGVSDRYATVYSSIINNLDILREVLGDDEIVDQSVKLAKQKQRYADVNRVERKSFREYARVENALHASNEAILSEFSKINFEIKKFKSKDKKGSGDVGIIHLSDTHFNELVKLDYNEYDFEVAAKRMQLFAIEAKRLFKSYGVKNVVLAMTGDMINSDRRLDEKLNMATNRMSAVLISVNLLQYFIQDLMNDFESMNVVYVSGNESRSYEFGFTDIVASDNYDSMIFNILELVMKNSKNIKFLASNVVETVINVNGKNILLLHGTTLGNAPQANIQKIIGKFAAKSVIVEYVLFGHIHFANVTDLYARSGSLVGSNSYADYGLGLISKASQNLHIVRKDKTINNFRIELQNTGDLPGYPIRSDLDAYNAKSASKLHPHKVVVVNEVLI